MKGFLSSNSTDSMKRLIAFLFSVNIIILSFSVKIEKILEIIVYGLFVMISLLLGLATVETIVRIFKKDNSQ